MFPIQCTTFVELWLQIMGDFFLQKNAFCNEKFLIFGGWGWGLKIFGPKYQKAYRYAKYDRINRLAYVAVAVFKRYTAPKKVCENTHWNFESDNNASLPQRRDVAFFVSMFAEHHCLHIFYIHFHSIVFAYFTDFTDSVDHCLQFSFLIAHKYTIIMTYRLQ